MAVKDLRTTVIELLEAIETYRTGGRWKDVEVKVRAVQTALGGKVG